MGGRTRHFERQAVSTFQIVRIVAVIVAAAVLFWLGQGLHLQLYFAIPAAL